MSFFNQYHRHFVLSLSCVALVLVSSSWGSNTVAINIKSYSMVESRPHWYHITEDGTLPEKVIVDGTESYEQESSRTVVLELDQVYNVGTSLGDLTGISAGTHIISIHFEAPPGYTVYMGSYESSVFNVETNGAFFDIQVARISDRAIGSISRPVVRDGVLMANLGLGRLLNGRPLGALRLNADIAGSAGVDSALELENWHFSRPYGGVWNYEGSSSVRQIKKRDIVVDMRQESEGLFIRYYDINDVNTTYLEGDCDPVTFTGDPFIEYKFSTSVEGELNITSSGTVSTDYKEYLISQPESDWEVLRIDTDAPSLEGISYLNHVESTTGGFIEFRENRLLGIRDYLVETHFVKDEVNSVEFQRIKKRIKDPALGSSKGEIDSNPSGQSFESHFGYDSYGRTSWEIREDGQWSVVQYSTNSNDKHFGEIERRVSPFRDSWLFNGTIDYTLKAESNWGDRIETTYSYGHQIPIYEWGVGGHGSYSERLSSRWPSKVEEWLYNGSNSYRVGLREFEYEVLLSGNESFLIVDETSYANADASNPGSGYTVRRVEHWEFVSGDETLKTGLPAAVIYPDGSGERYYYRMGDIAITASTDLADYATQTFTEGAGHFWMQERIFSRVINGIEPHTSPFVTSNVNHRSEKVQQIRDPSGRVILERNYIYLSGSWELQGWTAYKYDFAGRLLDSLKSNGLQYNALYNDKGQMWFEKKADGEELTYQYDGLSRRYETIRAGKSGVAGGSNLITNREFNSLGNVTKEIRSGGGEALMTVTAYDLAGNRKMHRDVNNYGTEWVYHQGTAEGSWIITNVEQKKFQEATDGNGDFNSPSSYSSQFQSSTYYSGELKARWGSALVNEMHRREWDSGDNQWRITSIYGEDNLEDWDPSGKKWKSSKYDSLGRIVRETEPNMVGSGQHRDYQYRPDGVIGAGQVWRITDEVNRPWLMEYDSMGTLIREGWDVDGNLSLNKTSSSDVVTEYFSEYFFENDTLMLLNRVSTWDEHDREIVEQEKIMSLFNPDDVENLNSVNLDRVTIREGFLLSKWHEVPQRVQWKTLLRDQQQLFVQEQEWVYPSGALRNRYSTIENGYHTFDDTYQTIHDNVDGIRREYDGLGRLVKETDPRGIETEYEYHPNSTQIKFIFDNLGNPLKQFEYCGCGNQVSEETIFVDGNTERKIYYDYTPMGQLEWRWGSGTTPVSYEYNDLGQKTKMFQYADGISEDPTSETEWTYHPNGLLWKKIDGLGRETEHIYDSSNRLWKIITPRYTGVDLTKEYHYPTSSGELPLLSGISYSQTGGSDIINKTPDLDFEYDRLGRLTKVTQSHHSSWASMFNINSQQVWSYDYEDDPSSVNYGRLKRENLPAMFNVPGGAPYLEHNYFNDTRWLESRELRNGSTSLWESSWTYLDDGRPASVSAESEEFTLGWSLGLRHLQEIDIKTEGVLRFERLRVLEEDRNLLKHEQSRRYYGSYSEVFNSAEFERNWQGQATERQLSGMQYAGYGPSGSYTTEWDYNARGELFEEYSETSNAVPLQDRYRAYYYDDAGNRLHKFEVSNVNGQIDYDRLANTNQYEEVYAAQQWGSLGQMYDVAQDANPQNFVPWVWQGPVNSWWYADVTSTSSSLRFWSTLFDVEGSDTNVSSRYFYNDMDQTTSSTINYPPKKRAVAYDFAGNMVDDGYLTYAYDAENRLVEVSDGDFIWRFLYDANGRRIRQQMRRTGSPSIVRADRFFAYDGWHVIAEFRFGMYGSLVTDRRYYWGPDISNTYGGAGGIGGLYMMKTATDSYAVTYDGLGNVSGLVKTHGTGFGHQMASFEYDAYGQIIRETGDTHLMPFRYQTKWHLAATPATHGGNPIIPMDIYDYGLRWYHPDQGRFVNRDPIGEAGGENLYAFVNNDPVNGRDMLGLSELPKSDTTYPLDPVWSVGHPFDFVEWSSSYDRDSWFSDFVNAQDYCTFFEGGIWTHSGCISMADYFNPSPNPDPEVDSGENKNEEAHGEKWSKERCDQLALQINNRRGGLERSLSSMNAGRSFLDTTYNEYVGSKIEPSLGIGGVIEYGADSLSLAGAALMPWGNRTQTAGMVVSAASSTTNAGLATYNFGKGNYGYALMHGTAAVTDLVSVASNTLPALKVVSGPVELGKAGIGGSMIAIDAHRRRQDTVLASQHWKNRLDSMQSIEAGIRNEISANESLYETHCR